MIFWELLNSKRQLLKISEELLPKISNFLISLISTFLNSTSNFKKCNFMSGLLSELKKIELLNKILPKYWSLSKLDWEFSLSIRFSNKTAPI